MIRPYRPEDLPAVRDVCLRTGYAGQDSRPVTRDHDLLPDTFAEPYLVAEPDLAFVADDGGRAVGYILGAADTAEFTAWFRAVWLPRAAARHPLPPGPPRDWEELIVTLLHNPERMIVPELADYPAHLHIDLLPGYQRQGLGLALMRTFLGALRDSGVARVHLGMDTRNTGARRFYDRCGFHLIEVSEPGVWYLGRDTATPIPASS